MKVYEKILKHRDKCPKWAKEFCLDCFGGGITKFTEEYNKEKVADLKKKIELSHFLVCVDDDWDNNEKAIELDILYKIIKEELG